MGKPFNRKAYTSARRRLGRRGMTLLWTPWCAEYRVSFRRGTSQEREDRAYYTSDLKDAVRTGIVMSRVQLPSEVKHAAV